MTTSPLRDRAAQAANGDPGTDVATTDNGAPQTIGALIHQLKPELQRALPRHLDGDRMARMALTVVRQNPNLARCTPQSFAGALLTAAALGLDIGPGGEVYLVPYKTECTLIVGFAGLAKLFWNTGMGETLDAQAVYANDPVFDYAYGTDQYLRHRPLLHGDRGDVIAYYAAAKLTTGGKAFVVLSPEEVKKLRGGRVGPQGDIPDPMRWMERKTALRQLLKLLPKSALLNTAIKADERLGSELYRERVDARRDERQLTAAPATEAAASADDDVADAELVDPTDEDIDRLPRPSGAAMTKAQQGKMQAQFEELAITGHDGRVAYCFDVIGREISTTSDLTKAEATKVIQAQARQLEEWASKAAES